MKKLIIIISLAISSLFAEHNVSDMNGDLNYKYPISSQLIKGHNLEVDITYNTNVSHTSMVYYFQDKNKFYQYTLPMPLWTINVNGFAINAFSHNTNPYSSEYKERINDYPSGDTIFMAEFLKNLTADDDFHNGYLKSAIYNNVWLIEGYDYCNRMSVLADGEIDEIKILRGDGSVLKFKNQNRYDESESINDPKFYTGLYYHDSYNSNIYAKVEFDTLSYFPEYISKYLPNDASRIQKYPRVMKVYMGDGLEYEFREWISPYGARIIDKVYQLDSLNQNISDSLKIDVFPTIFYLERINTSIGEMTSFTREHHNFNSNEVDVYKGHSWTTDFYGHHIDNSTENTVIDAYGKSYKIKNLIQPLNFYGEINNLQYNLGHILLNELFSEENNQDSSLGLLKIMDKSNELYSSNKDIDYNFSTSMFGLQINPKSRQLYPFREYARYFKMHITEIIDPENNKVKFDYQNVYKSQISDTVYVDYYTGYKRLNKIEQNNKIVFFNYYGSIDFNQSKISNITYPMMILQDTISTSEYYDFLTDYYEDDDYKYSTNRLYLNSIDKVVEIEKINGTVADTLSIANYSMSNIDSFTDYHNPSYTFTEPFKVTKTQYIDKKLDISTTIESIYRFYTINQFWYESVDDNDYRYEAPMLWRQFSYNNDLKEDCDFDDLDSYLAITYSVGNLIGGSSLFIYPDSYRNYVYHQDSIIKTQHINLEYEFETYDGFDGNTIFASKLGKVLKKEIVKDMYVDSVDVVYKKQIKEYENLDFDTESLTAVNDSILDYKATYKKIVENNRKGIETYDEIIRSSVKNITQVKPPVIGLLKSIYEYDRNDDIISGAINVYNINQTGNLPSARRGVILADSLVGRYGNTKYLNTTYVYNGSRYNSEIKYIIGANNDTTEMSYSFGPYGNISSTKWLNTENTESVSLYKTFPYYDIPVKETKQIKFYDDEGNLTTKSLTNYMEYNSIGLASKIVDYNGNLTVKQYDKIGRETQLNLPYDFPANGKMYTSIDNCIPLEKQRTIVQFRQDTVNYYDSIPSIKIGNWTNIDTIPYDLEVKKYTDLNFESRDTVLEFTTHTLSNYNSIVEVTYKSDINDALHTTTPDSIKLRLSFVGNNINNCTGINIKTNKFGFEKQYLLGCLPLLSVPGVESSGYGNSSDIMLIDLSEIQDSLANMGDNEEMKITIEINSPDGNLKIQSFNEDNDICISPSYGASTGKNDYTYKLEYEDETQTIVKYTKVDDAKFATHSYKKGYAETFSDYDGRYYKSISYKSGNNDTYKSELYIGHPNSYDRIDSAYKEYDKINHQIHSYDLIGEKSVSTVDESNKISSNASYNDTVSTEIAYFKPGYYFDLNKDKYNLQDDFHGIMKVNSTRVNRSNNNDYNIFTYTFFDGLGRLRAKVSYGEVETPQIDTFRIVYYNYNDIGQLAEVINDNGDTTKYKYDEFGNLKYKYHKDMGLSSYGYSKTGQLRFSQSQIQADDNKVNYYQYDDLGRQTVVGEAKIDETGLELSEPDYPSDLDDNVHRLTDTLNPNIINDGVSTILTANKTLFDNSLSPTPIDYQIETTTLNPKYKYFPEDTLSQHMLILNKSVNFEVPNLTALDYEQFEDIKNSPQTVLQAFQYDTLIYKGNVFGKMPDYLKWDSLNQNWDNLKGNVSAIAYRNNSAQNFNYIRYSYDARSRIKKMIRFTENIGFDGVYYDYNSHNQVTSMTVIDPLRSFKIWYSYDINGRVDSVWAKVDTVGSGFGVNGKLHQPYAVARDSKAVFYYTYTKRGAVDTMLFTPNNLIKKHYYNNNGWLDSIKVIKDNLLVYAELINRDDYGNIEKITDKFDSFDPNKVFASEFSTNQYKELTNWKFKGVTKEQYTYDKIGNRLTKTSGAFTQNYNYGAGLSSNKLMSIDYQSYQKQFIYNNNGAVSYIADSVFGSSPELIEEFNYNNFNKLSAYLKYDTSGTDYSSCSPSRQEPYWDWRYNYSPTGGIESKKLYSSPQGNECGVHPFNYYLQGAKGEMLVEFNGKEWSKDTINTIHQDDRIYYYAKAYNVPGTNFRFKRGISDSSKFNDYDWFIQDHNGGTKLLVNSTSNMFNPQKKYLYYPYGDTLKSAMVGNYDSDLNAFGELASHEMPYSQMGYRIYSEDFGRFLSPDPLFEQFDSWTPYHFGFNNPVMYSDPSGLAPKKEKREVKLLDASDIYSESDLGHFGMLNEMFALQMEESRRSQDKLEEQFFGDWEEFDRWQAVTRNKMNGGGGGDKYDNSYDLALAAENKKAAAKKEKENKEKGNVEEEAIDNGYTTEEVKVYGEQPIEIPFGLWSFFNHAKNGGGKSVLINLGEVDLSMLSASEDFKNEVGFENSINTQMEWPFFSETGLILGSVNFKYMGNNEITAQSDMFDFDMHTGNDFKTLARNFATKIGSDFLSSIPFEIKRTQNWPPVWTPVGYGYTPFKIHFYGRGKIGE